MSRHFEDLYKGLQEAIQIIKGELRLVPHPAQDRLTAPTFIAVTDETRNEEDNKRIAAKG